MSLAKTKVRRVFPGRSVLPVQIPADLQSSSARLTSSSVGVRTPPTDKGCRVPSTKGPKRVIRQYFHPPDGAQCSNKFIHVPQPSSSSVRPGTNTWRIHIGVL